VKPSQLLVAALLAAGAGTAHAQGAVTYTPEMDPDRFVLTSDARSIGELDGARPLSKGNFSLGVAMRVGGPPLQVCVADGSGMCADEGNLVRSRFGADVVAAFGWQWLGVYAQLPVILNQGSDYDPATARISSAGLADLRLGGKAMFLDRGPHAMGVDVRFTVPTGGADDFTGDGGTTAESRLIYDWRKGRYGAVAQLGYAWRSQSSRIANLYVDDEMLWGIGGEYWVKPEKATVGLSAFGRIGLKDNPMEMGDAASPGEEEMPAELMASGRWWAEKNWIAEVAAGVGLTEGYGAPSFRALAGVRWIKEKPFAKKPPARLDRDGDGYFDDEDGCPLRPEDFDQFEDKDGCPDFDNDKDGIPDKSDACPMDPEDKDGFEDVDGCPDPDNDKDTILDKADACTNAPEDFDGYQDIEGCPDPDNDMDTVLDKDDPCPNDPEDVDGFQDNDGCPDLDNDQDGVQDKDDKCPNEPETYNGHDDTDGCPDAAPTVVVTGTAVEIKEVVHFDTDKATIKPKSFALLDGVAAAIIAHKLSISIEGHTDDRAKDDYNMTLSQKRSDAVRAYLISKGVAADHLTATGYGETRPKVPGKSAKAREANRRVEFIIVGGNVTPGSQGPGATLTTPAPTVPTPTP
jgi:outer membrane protein OmpA-like peptidoglycan-associated protein